MNPYGIPFYELEIYDISERMIGYVQRRWNRRMPTSCYEMQMALGFGEIVGQNPALLNMRQQIEMVAPTDASVLILEESGTGKQLITRAIHADSHRSAKTMVKVNGGAILREWFESEFKVTYKRGVYRGFKGQEGAI